MADHYDDWRIRDLIANRKNRAEALEWAFSDIDRWTRDLIAGAGVLPDRTVHVREADGLPTRPDEAEWLARMRHATVTVTRLTGLCFSSLSEGTYGTLVERHYPPTKGMELSGTVRHDGTCDLSLTFEGKTLEFARFVRFGDEGLDALAGAYPGSELARALNARKAETMFRAITSPQPGPFARIFGPRRRTFCWW